MKVGRKFIEENNVTSSECNHLNEYLLFLRFRELFHPKHRLNRYIKT